jgi:hypothetical protein
LHHADLGPGRDFPAPIPLGKTQIDNALIVWVPGIKFKEGATD